MRIVIACSGSGGHLFPAIAVAQELKKAEESCEIFFVTGRRMIAGRILKKEGFPFVSLPQSSISNLLGFIPFLIRLSQVLIRSFIILRRMRPNLVLGFGGFISGPILLFAHLCRIPTIIHEQNVVPGRTNLILGRFVDAIAISFEESGNVFKDKDKLIFAGSFIRNSLHIIDKGEATRNFGFKPENFTLLVMGGSQGAHSINQAIVKVFERFTLEERRQFQIVHIAGEMDYQMVKDQYRDLNLNSKVYSFLEEIDYAYSASDLVISRSGATAISEIASFGKAAVLVPYPYARSHQLSNAGYMAERNVAILLKEDKHLAEQLYDKILNFRENRDQIQRFSKPPKLDQSATKNMVELILNLKSDDG